MLKWLRYSGFSVTFSGNPLHWNLIPVCRKEPESVWEAAHTWTLGWLFFTLRFWLDDGSW